MSAGQDHGTFENPFSVNVLPDISPFRLADDYLLGTQEHTSAEGRKYKMYVVRILTMDSKTFVVDLFRRDLERIRVLQALNGHGYINATFAAKQTEEEFDRVLFGNAPKGTP